MSTPDLEAIRQYEKMLSVEEALIGAEHDVNIEEITEVRAVVYHHVYTYSFVLTNTCTYIILCILIVI